ncbi:esterase [Clostridium swellfunianum]|uniref:esterase n=1 Tax=Clostridium swellfunianum TaxID=1367462 RepID=UPI00202F3294|nr:esterase [Clostridium swellfunianum]MCM0648631.1 esterase [Clostridium swellfunianum]
MNITSIDELKNIAKGQIVELPGFGDGKPFVCRVKRASLLGLAVNGAIPNPLLSAANQIFFGKSSNKQEVSLKETGEIFEIVAKDCLVEPSYEQIKEAGLTLTDDQVVTLFNYSQEGLKALEHFRTEQGNTEDNKNLTEI